MTIAVSLPEYLKDFFELTTTISKPNADHRTIAIVGMSFIDDGVREILELAMPGLNSKLRDKIFDGYGPLSTLAARLDVARALGLMRPQEHTMIVSLARVRNRMAHNLHVHDFDHPDVATILDQVEITISDGTTGKETTQKGPLGGQPRWSFYQTCITGVAMSIQRIRTER